MKPITILYRKKKEGRYSIEGLFSPIDKLQDVRRVELPYDLNSVLNVFKLLLFALKIKGQRIHITGDIHYMAFFLFWKKVAITVHDCHHYENLKGLKKILFGLIWYRIPIAFSNRVIVISPFVKEQLQQHFHVKNNKIIIIPNSFRPIPKVEVSNTCKYFTILVIGTKTNKNLIRLFEAIKGLENIKLQIIGNLHSKQILAINQYNISYSNDLNVSQEKLNEFYNSSQMLYFGSTKEGFGLPILEAQSCGLPVLTSNTTSMPYVAGYGSLIVDPYNVDAIRKAILNIINDENLRINLIKNGYKNIERFKPSHFISNYLKTYSSL